MHTPTSATTAPASSRTSRIARVWLTILLLLTLVVPATSAGASAVTATEPAAGTDGDPGATAAPTEPVATDAPTQPAAGGTTAASTVTETTAAETAQVTVYFTAAASECEAVNPYARTVSAPAVATGALQALLAGPTDAERPSTATGFGSATAGMLRSVVIRDGVAHVDLGDLRPLLADASSSCGSTSLLAQLDATVMQFPTVHRARYSINGSEAAFYEWLQRDAPGQGSTTSVRGSLQNTAMIRRTHGAEATLRRIRVGRHAGFDRLVLEFDGGRPAYTVRYTGVPMTGGAGAPIPVGGTAALQIDLQAHTIDMTSGDFPKTFAPVGPLTPRFPTLRQVHYGGEFEGVSTFGAGLTGRSGFRVVELANPTRLAIDVAHGATVRRLRRGDRGADVRDWQQQLNAVQFGPFASSPQPGPRPLVTDGAFGPATAVATRVFQRAEGVPDTGLVGPATRSAMRQALRRAAAIRP